MSHMPVGCRCLKGLQFLSFVHPGKQGGGEGMVAASISSVKTPADVGPLCLENCRHFVR